jgi:hypothetical protein
MKLTEEQIESLASFVLELLDEWPELSNFDGGDIQDLAEKHKILIPQTMYAPCGEFCNCNQVVYDEEWHDGVTCYHMADWLARDAQQRNEADDAGAVDRTKELEPKID